MRKHILSFLTKACALVLLFAFREGDNIELASSRLQMVREAYNHLSDYSMTVVHRYYKKIDENFPENEYKGFYAQSPPRYYSNLLGVKTIQDGKYKISIDTSDKLIVVGKADSSFRTADNIDYPKLLKACRQVDYLTSSAGTTIIMSFPPSEYFPYKMIRLYINGKNIINKIQIVYNPTVLDQSKKKITAPVEVEINYSDFKTQKTPDSFFNTDGVVSINGKRITVASKYQNYRLINNVF